MCGFEAKLTNSQSMIVEPSYSLENWSLLIYKTKLVFSELPVSAWTVQQSSENGIRTSTYQAMGRLPRFLLLSSDPMYPP